MRPILSKLAWNFVILLILRIQEAEADNELGIPEWFVVEGR